MARDVDTRIRYVEFESNRGRDGRVMRKAGWREGGREGGRAGGRPGIEEGEG